MNAILRLTNDFQYIGSNYARELKFSQDITETQDQLKKGICLTKINCWEFMKCGRQLGGEKTKELGTCPAAVENETDGIYGGKNGGRCCYIIEGTLCEGKVQGNFAEKVHNCLQCVFFKFVCNEEGRNFDPPVKILALMDNNTENFMLSPENQTIKIKQER